MSVYHSAVTSTWMRTTRQNQYTVHHPENCREQKLKMPFKWIKQMNFCC